MIEGDLRRRVDAALISAAQRVEHYEIAAYGTVRTYARFSESKMPLRCSSRLSRKKKKPTRSSRNWRKRSTWTQQVARDRARSSRGE